MMDDDGFKASQPLPVDGVAIEDETNEAKGARIRWFLDEFVDADTGLTAISWRGQAIMLVKHNPVHHDRYIDIKKETQAEL